MLVCRNPKHKFYLYQTHGTTLSWNQFVSLNILEKQIKSVYVLGTCIDIHNLNEWINE